VVGATLDAKLLFLGHKRAWAQEVKLQKNRIARNNGHEKGKKLTLKRCELGYLVALPGCTSNFHEEYKLTTNLAK